MVRMAFFLEVKNWTTKPKLELWLLRLTDEAKEAIRNEATRKHSFIQFEDKIYLSKIRRDSLKHPAALTLKLNLTNFDNLIIYISLHFLFASNVVLISPHNAYYVSVNGSDNSVGTQLQSLKNIQA